MDQKLLLQAPLTEKYIYRKVDLGPYEIAN